MFSNSTSHNIDRSNSLVRAQNNENKKFSLSIEKTGNKIHSKITYINNTGNFSQLYSNGENKHVEFDFHKILQSSKECFLDNISEKEFSKIVDSHKRKSSFRKILRSSSEKSAQSNYFSVLENLKKNSSRSFDNQKATIEEDINEIIASSVYNDKNPYIYTNINRIINKKNIELKNMGNLPITKQERDIIYHYVGNRNQLQQPENPEKLLTSTTIWSVTSNKSVYDEVKKLATSNSEDSSLYEEIIVSSLYSISDELFKYYHSDISIGNIRMTTENAIKHTLKDRKQ